MKCHNLLLGKCTLYSVGALHHGSSDSRSVQIFLLGSGSLSSLGDSENTALCFRKKK